MRGLLLYGDTVRAPALRHEIPIAIIDPVLFAEVDGRRHVLTSYLERDRIKRTLPDAELLDYVELGYRKLVQQGMSMLEAGREVEARAVQEIGIKEAIVPGDFPLALGDRLREDGVVLTVDDAAVGLRRRAKSPVEIEGIRVAQRAAEAGMAAAAGLLARCEPGEDGRLELDGVPLLAEDVRATLRAACEEHGAPCPPDVIVASVWQGGGHEPGSGPLPAGPGPDEEDGFQHSLGHGVGLEVHEAPPLGLAGRDPLVVGDVIAIEPGLSDSRLGMVIFEDLVLVTETGCEVLTRFPYDLTP